MREENKLCSAKQTQNLKRKYRSWPTALPALTPNLGLKPVGLNAKFRLAGKLLSIDAGKNAPLEQLATANEIDRTPIGRILQLTRLSLKIVEQIPGGNQSSCIVIAGFQGQGTLGRL